MFVENFLTEILSLPLVNSDGRKIGEVEDVAVLVGEVFPKVIGFLKKGYTKHTFIPINKIRKITTEAIMVEEPAEEKKMNGNEAHILLKRDLLDKQIVDTDGLKVVRVNDLKLKTVGEDIRLIAADIGSRGIFRRLGLEKIIAAVLKIFFIKLPEKLISWNFVAPFGKSLANVKLTISHSKFTKLHPSDVAQIISQVPAEEKLAIFELLNTGLAQEVLHELDPEVQKSLVEGLKPYQAASILENMPPDEASDVLGDLSEEKTQELLSLMRPKDSFALKKLLKHEDSTAGGLMTPEFFTISENMTVEAVIEKLRQSAPDAETIYYLYVVDELERLKGVLSLRKLIISPAQNLIKDIASTSIIKVRAEEDQREVADLISKYNLLALPVVDPDDKILGIITVDDVINLILPPLSRKKRFGLG